MTRGRKRKNRTIDKRWVPWSSASADIDFNSKLMGVGNGEHKLAAELGFKLTSRFSSHDAINEDLKIEIKQPNKSNTIRCTNKHADLIHNILIQIRDAAYEASRCIDYARIELGFDFRGADTFIKKFISKIEKNMLSKNLMFGKFYGRYIKGKWSFKDIVRLLSSMRKRYNSYNIINIDGVEATVDTCSYVRFMKEIYGSWPRGSYNRVCYPLSFLQHEMFDRPSLLEEMWDSIKASNAFNADKIALVDAQRGYVLIDKQELDDVFSFYDFNLAGVQFIIK